MEWKIIAIQFQKKTGLPYDKSKLKHKWDWMKSRWRRWKALKWKEAGLGWDHEKGIISASEECWENKIKENIHFRAFQDEGIEPELEDKMKQLFGVSVAHRIHKFTPAEQEKETNCFSPSSSSLNSLSPLAEASPNLPLRSFYQLLVNIPSGHRNTPEKCGVKHF